MLAQGLEPPGRYLKDFKLTILTTLHEVKGNTLENNRKISQQRNRNHNKNQMGILDLKHKMSEFKKQNCSLDGLDRT